MNGAAQWGYCPVTGKNVSVASAFQVNFINGQKLYVADAAAAAAYRAAPQAFCSPHESQLPMPDGMRGFPDFRGKAFCVRPGENITVDRKRPAWSTATASRSTSAALVASRRSGWTRLLIANVTAR